MYENYEIILNQFLSQQNPSVPHPEFIEDNYLLPRYNLLQVCDAHFFKDTWFTFFFFFFFFFTSHVLEILFWVGIV